MSNTIKVTTGDLINHAKSISNLAMFVGEISSKNSSAINKMEAACSSFRVAGIYVSANRLIGKFTDLTNELTRGASKALGCASAYQEASDNLENKFKDWFENVVVGEASSAGVMEITKGNMPVNLDDYFGKVSDAEYAKLNQIWTDVCNSDDPLNEFIKRLSELPENDPLRNIAADQIEITKSISGLAAITLTDNNGNALVIFAGTNGGEIGDIANDIMIATGNMSPQELEAISIIAQLSSTHPNITVTGYSLGGYLATAATLRCPAVSRCVTFDPPGRYDNLFQSIFNNENYSKITTYEANGSIVSGVGTASGGLQKLNVENNWAGPFFPNHGIEYIYNSLGGDYALKNTWDTGYIDLYTGKA